MGFNHEVLVSELKMMRDKEKEMISLYEGILSELEHPRLHARLSAVRDDEQRHMGYCDILLSLFENGPEGGGPSGGSPPGDRPRSQAFR